MMTRNDLETKYCDLLTYIIENKGSNMLDSILTDIGMTESEYYHIENVNALRLIAIIENMQIYARANIHMEEQNG